MPTPCGARYKRMELAEVVRQRGELVVPEVQRGERQGAEAGGQRREAVAARVQRRQRGGQRLGESWSVAMRFT